MTNKQVNGQLTTANPNKDGTTGAYITLVTGTANGTKVNQIDITALNTTTQGMIRMFINDATTTRLYREIPVPIDPSTATDPGWTTSVRPTNLILTTSQTLKLSTEKSEVFDVVASVTEF
jgi:hypothetical protein